jgi:N-formylglutamate deformylase
MSVLFHVPHASTVIPDDVRAGIVVDDDLLGRELLEATDHHTDGIVAGLVNDTTIRSYVNRYSRLVVDPERFLDVGKEITEAVGRGVVATRTVNGERFRDDTAHGFAALRQNLIERFFLPYHHDMDRLVDDMLGAYGTVTILDVHSFPEHAQPYELDAQGQRPPLCIGTDSMHTSHTLKEIVTDAANRFGFAYTFDRPFAGTFVPLSHYGDARVQSLMFEFRRDIFTDEATATPHAGIAKCRSFVADVTRQILS